MVKQIPKKTGECGCEISIIKRFQGLYCDKFCCKHCPDANNFPCENERKFGTPLEKLNKIRDEEQDKNEM
ncbi:MAG: hypothetical protein ACFFDB_00645 [Promethearchaeota archaeon]